MDDGHSNRPCTTLVQLTAEWLYRQER